jgi:hypothetical protein
MLMYFHFQKKKSGMNSNVMIYIKGVRCIFVQSLKYNTFYFPIYFLLTKQEYWTFKPLNLARHFKMLKTYTEIIEKSSLNKKI